MMRSCKVCGKEIPKAKDCTDPITKARFCGIECLSLHGREKAQAARERKRKAKHRADKDRLKTKSQHMREAQQAFNAYIRERDRDLPCISCGKVNPGGDPRGGVWDCSHYRSVGANPELRFEPLNAHKGCKNCNRDKSGNIVDYRIYLQVKIGQESLEWLEGPHEPKRYAIDDLRKIKAKYRALTRELKKHYNDT